MSIFSVFYSLYENLFTKDPNDYIARVTSTGSVDLDGIVDDILKQGTTLTRPDLLSAFDALHAAVTARVIQGFRVSTPLANFGLSISGLFNGPSDGFNSARHLINPVVSAGSQLCKDVRAKAKPEKLEATKATPHITQFRDFGSESVNSILTSGGPGQLSGHRLKFDPEDAAQGIFLLTADGRETRATMIMMNKPSELMFMVPQLEPGDYLVAVRAILQGAKEVRQGLLEQSLSVIS